MAFTLSLAIIRMDRVFEEPSRIIGVRGPGKSTDQVGIMVIRGERKHAYFRKFLTTIGRTIRKNPRMITGRESTIHPTIPKPIPKALISGFPSRINKRSGVVRGAMS